MRFIVLALLSFSYLTSIGQKDVKLEELKDHIGDSVKVNGKISGARYLETAKDSPTFLNVGGVYPNQDLTIVIWGEVRKKMNYNPAEKKNIGGMAVVTGKVELFKNKPQIVINDPSQLLILVDEEVPASQVPPIERNN
jgi:DNA/RNA endonuclease YhcR with UshA esterase domain